MNLRCYELAVQFYRRVRTKKMPYHLKDQLQRASSSIALNLNEGWGKKGRRDRVKFFQIAFGSIREVQGICKLEPESFDQSDISTLDHLAASVYKLIKNSRVP